MHEMGIINAHGQTSYGHASTYATQRSLITDSRMTSQDYLLLQDTAHMYIRYTECVWEIMIRNEYVIYGKIQEHLSSPIQGCQVWPFRDQNNEFGLFNL